jgi:Kef-type K+ transport system membrane component KefB
VPVVVGEILAGVLIGRTGLRVLHTGNPTLSFLSDIGFAMLMFTVGMNVPLHDSRLRSAVGRGGVAALITAAFAVGGGVLVSHIAGAGHPAVYAVLLASASAAVVLPVLEERGLAGGPILTLIAQVTVADILATVAIPFVLRPSRAGHAVVGTLATAGGVLVLFALASQLRRIPWTHDVRRLSKRRHWAIDLRAALIALFGLAWIAQRTGASLLIAGFGAGLMVAVIGGPKRLGTEVLGVGGGFFIPLFFVVLGAKLDLRGVVSDPAMLELAGALAALAVAVHVAGARATRQPRGAGLVSSAQLGVPAAIVALGLPAHVLNARQAAAVVAASLITLAACAIGAGRLASSAAASQRDG